MSENQEPWTIERICAALGDHPDINKRIWAELNRASASTLLDVFAKWQGRAERTLEAVASARSALEAGTLYDDTIDITDEITAKANRHAA